MGCSQERAYSSSGSCVDVLIDSSSDDLSCELASRLRFDSAGLICAVIQDAANGEVLMVGWMDATALARTLTTGRVWFWSRSRQEYWRKGDTSEHVQYVHSVDLDCDADAVLVKVTQVGAACHTGTRSCFESGGSLHAVVGDSSLDSPDALGSFDSVMSDVNTSAVREG